MFHIFIPEFIFAQVVSWFQFAIASGHNKIANLCREFITWNFGVVAENIDFPNMETENIVSFLKRSDLVIQDEISVFKVRSILSSPLTDIK